VFAELTRFLEFRQRRRERGPIGVGLALLSFNWLTTACGLFFAVAALPEMFQQSGGVTPEPYLLLTAILCLPPILLAVVGLSWLLFGLGLHRAALALQLLPFAAGCVLGLVLAVGYATLQAAIG
jgi:hypothetical protein